MRHVVHEYEIKRLVTAFLKVLTDEDSPVRCYYRMPVPGGYGKSGLDYEGCIEGFYFAIETKADDPHVNLTPRQRECALDILAGGGKVFIISTAEGLNAFQRWVLTCCKA
jgi:hypothetical protein